MHQQPGHASSRTTASMVGPCTALHLRFSRRLPLGPLFEIPESIAVTY